MNISSLRLRPLSPADLGLGALVAAMVTGIWFAGDFHSLHDNDSIIHSLNSLYRWTVFVWEYDHIGSVLAWLVQPVHQPYWNVVALSALAAFLFLTGLALWASMIAPIPFTESILWVTFLLPLMMTRHALFQLGSHSVASGAALFFSAGYICILQQYLRAPHNRFLIPGLVGLAFLSIYVSKLAFFPLAAITGGLLWTHRRLPGRMIVTVCACLTLAFLGYQLLEWSSPYKRDYTLDLSILPVGLPRLFDNWAKDAMTGIAWLAAPLLALLNRSTRSGVLLRGMAAGVFIQTLIIACSRWTRLNSYAAHYLFDLSFLTVLATLALLVSLVRHRLAPRLQQVLPSALLLAMLGLNVHTWHAYRPGNPFARMERALGANTPSIVSAQCDLLVGDNWLTWPAMLAVNDHYYRNQILDPQTRQTRRVYAITYLSASTESLWRPILDRPHSNLCSLAGDEAGYKRYLSLYAPDIAYQTVPISRTGSVIVHRIRTAPLQFVRLDFDTPAPGDGWSALVEVTPNGETFQWMEDTIATILLPLAAERDRHVEFRVIHAMSTDILQSLTLRVNNQAIQLDATGLPGGGTLFKGLIPQHILAKAIGPSLFEFKISRTIVPRLAMPPSDDDRALGLALDWLVVK